MDELVYRFRNKVIEINRNNKGVAVVEVILILVVLIGLVVIFKSKATSLINKIWKAVTKGSVTMPEFPYQPLLLTEL